MHFYDRCVASGVSPTTSCLALRGELALGSEMQWPAESVTKPNGLPFCYPVELLA